MNERPNETQIQVSEVATPESFAPSLKELQEAVQTRRNFRAVRMRVLGSVSVVLCMIIGAWTLKSSEVVAPSLPQPTDVIVNVADQDSPATNVAMDTDSESDAPFRVFAKVRQPVPVFQKQEGTEYLHHIGWMNSERVVPVDTKQFLPEQRQQFEAVLQDDAKTEWISL